MQVADQQMNEVPPNKQNQQGPLDMNSSLQDASELDEIIQNFIESNIEQIDGEKHPQIQAEVQSFSDVNACKVCFRIYNTTQNWPKMLLCGHTYCIDCLIQIKSQIGSLICPVCKFDEKTKILQLPTNYLALDGVEICKQKIYEIKQRLLNNISIMCTIHAEEKIINYGETKHKPYCKICLLNHNGQLDQQLLSVGHLVERMHQRSSEICNELINSTKFLHSKIDDSTWEASQKLDQMVCNIKQNGLNLIKYIQFTTQDQIFKLKIRFEEFVKDIKEKEIKYDLAEITRLKDSSSIQLDENLVLNKEAFTDLKSLLIQKQINLECLEKVSDINYIQQVNQLFKKQFSKCKHLILDKGKINMYSLICDGNQIL